MPGSVLPIIWLVNQRIPMNTCAKAWNSARRPTIKKWWAMPAPGCHLHVGNWDFLLKVLSYGERAQKIAESFPSDQYLFFKSLAGLCFIYFYKGDTNRVFEGAKRLLEYGERNANSRSKVFGHFMKAFGHLAAGDMKSAQKSSEKAIEVALDPFYAQFPKTTLGVAYFLGGQLQEAENILQSVHKFL